MTNPIIYDNNFVEFLQYTRPFCRISEVLFADHLLKPAGTFVKVESSGSIIDQISYVPLDKATSSAGFYETKYRTKINIGRMPAKFLKKEVITTFISNSDVEQFVNLFKGYFNTNLNSFEVISGDEILKWYLDINYHAPGGFRAGQLWNSCMRYHEKNEFMRIYAENPNDIKMLIHRDSDGKLRTRALLWENCVDHMGKKHKIMDRIYSIYDHEITSFKKWALDNGYSHKYEQSSKSELHFVTSTGIEKLYLKAFIKNHKMDLYPYIDTFKFYSETQGYLSNTDRFEFNYILIQNNGSKIRERRISEDDDNIEFEDDFDIELDVLDEG